MLLLSHIFLDTEHTNMVTQGHKWNKKG